MIWRVVFVAVLAWALLLLSTIHVTLPVLSLAGLVAWAVFATFLAFRPCTSPIHKEIDQ